MTTAVMPSEERTRMTSAGTMQALVFHGPNQISLDNMPIPHYELFTNQRDGVLKVAVYPRESQPLKPGDDQC